jgi:predicted RNA binding protein YcfA (HicA-like mRNA interferase family)
VHVRRGKHDVYKLPNGKTFTMSCSPSKPHELDIIRDIKRLMQD